MKKFKFETNLQKRIQVKNYEDIEDERVQIHCEEYFMIGEVIKNDELLNLIPDYMGMVMTGHKEVREASSSNYMGKSINVGIYFYTGEEGTKYAVIDAMCIEK